MTQSNPRFEPTHRRPHRSARGSSAPRSATMKAIVSCLWLLLAIPALADGPGVGFQITKSIQSPEHHTVADFYFKDGDTKRQIWLRPATSQTAVDLLCEYERDADLSFSPDEGWIGVNDSLGSDVSEVRLFRRVAGTKYDEDKRAAVTEKTWRFLAKHYGLTRVPELDHMYSELVRWAANSKAFMVALDGHTDLAQHIDSWVCIYDLTTFQPSLDLSLMNRATVHLRGKTFREAEQQRGADAHKGARGSR